MGEEGGSPKLKKARGPNVIALIVVMMSLLFPSWSLPDPTTSMFAGLTSAAEATTNTFPLLSTATATLP